MEIAVFVLVGVPKKKKRNDDSRKKQLPAIELGIDPGGKGFRVAGDSRVGDEGAWPLDGRPQLDSADPARKGPVQLQSLHFGAVACKGGPKPGRSISANHTHACSYMQSSGTK